MTWPIIHRAITSLCRALGIVATTEDVVIMPLSKWHEWHEEKERVKARVAELEKQLAAVEQGRTE